MTWKRSTAVIVSVAAIAVSVKLVLACGPEQDPYDSYATFFQNNITAQPQYSPFYFTEYGPLYDDWGYDNYNTMPEDDARPNGNTNEWYTYANKAAKQSDIDSFMKKYSYQQVKGLVDKKGNELKNNTFAKYLLNPKNKEVLDYMLYAKRCEPLNATLESRWDETSKTYTEPVKDTTQRRKLIAEGVTMNGKTKNEFLKWRYAYQALRLALYSEDYSSTLALYEKMIGKKTGENLIYARCIALKAGALFHTGKKKMAAYLYSRAFDLSDDMKLTAGQSFMWASDSVKSADLQALCKTPHEKAVLLVMDGLHERANEGMEGLKLMQKAYTLDPNVKGLDVIMTREMNKAELRYMAERQNAEGSLYTTGNMYYLYDNDDAKGKDEWKKKKAKYKTYLNELDLFAQKVAANTKTTDKAFWMLASSYACYMLDKFADSKKYLDLAGKEKMNTHERDVHDVMNILAIVHSSDKMNAETEAQLLPCLQWVEKREGKSTRFAKVYRDLMNVVLTDKYMQQKDTVKALYCQARVFKDKKEDGFVVSDDYSDVPGSLLEHMSTDKMHEVEAFVNKGSKTEFEQWLTDNTPYPLVTLKEVEGTKYIRELNFEKAAAVLATVPREILNETVLPDFLVSHLEDSQEWNRSDSAKTYNKLEFAQKMATLKKTIEKQPNNGRVAYQYANGLYNMSYYGRAHNAVDYYRRTSDPDAYFSMPSRKAFPAKKEYYGVFKAQKYYLVAVSATSDPEMKARCLFLAAKCVQKNCDPGNVKNKYEISDQVYYQNSLNNPHLERLYNEFKMTKFYHEAYSSCSYLRDYAKRNK